MMRSLFFSKLIKMQLRIDYEIGGDGEERLIKRLASEENRRDFEIPKELYGNYYEIINKDIKKTKDLISKVVKSVK